MLKYATFLGLISTWMKIQDFSRPETLNIRVKKFSVPVRTAYIQPCYCRFTSYQSGDKTILCNTHIHLCHCVSSDPTM